jgi:hypothetical protein
MKTTLLSTALTAGVLGLFLCSPAANAATVSILSQDTTVLPTSDNLPIPTSTSGNFIQSTSGSSPGQLSPWTGAPPPQVNNAYSVLNSGGGVPGDAIYNLSGPNNTGFTFLWGSPDTYNSVVFFSGAGGLGTVEGSFTGSSLSPPAPGTGFDFITFTTGGTGTIGSVELLDNGTAAFEYADVTPTPIPGALSLFAGGLGLMGVFSRRKRRQGSAALAA